MFTVLILKKYVKLTEAEIIKGCKQRKNKAQKALFMNYSADMRIICQRYARDKMEASDILQEAFIRVFNKINQFSGQGSFEGWLKRIFINTAINHYNKNRKHYHHYELENFNQSLMDDSVKGEINNNHEIDKEDINLETINYQLIENADISKDEIIDILNILNPDYKIVFNLFVIEDYSHNEIAENLNINEKTSRTRLYKAKKIIQKELYDLSINKLAR